MDTFKQFIRFYNEAGAELSHQSHLAYELLAEGLEAKENKTAEDWEKLLKLCIEYNDWYSILLTVDTTTLTDQRISEIIKSGLRKVERRYKVPVLSQICKQVGWGNKDLNAHLLELISKDRDIGSKTKTEKRRKLKDQTEIDVYYPLAWCETIEEALRMPRWYLSVQDAMKSVADTFTDRTPEETTEWKIKTAIIHGKVRRDDIVLIDAGTYDIPDGFGDSYGDFIKERINFVLLNRPATFVEYYPEEEICKADVSGGLKEALKQVENRKIIFPKERIETVSDGKCRNRKDFGKLIRSYLRCSDKQLKNIVAKNFADGDVWYCGEKGRQLLKNSEMTGVYTALLYSAYDNTFYKEAVQRGDNKLFGVVTGNYLKNRSDVEKEYINKLVVLVAVNTTQRDADLESAGLHLSKQEEETDVFSTAEGDKTEFLSSTKEERKESIDEIKAILERHRVQIKELEQLVEDQMQESTTLRNEIAETTKEKHELQKKNDALTKAFSDGGDKTNPSQILNLHKGAEQAKYDGEYESIVVDALCEYLKNCERGTRRYDIISAFVQENIEYKNILDQKRERIKNGVQGYRHADQIVKVLEDENLSVEKGESGHIKVMYPDDERYIAVGGSTPSDSRSGKNFASVVNNKLL